MMGRDHALRIEHEIKGAHLAVVSDIDFDRASAVIAESGSSVARHVVDPDQAIVAPDVDAVIIAAPDQFHVSLTIAALRAGKPVLCEKPLAPTSSECLEVLNFETELAAAGRPPMVTLGFMRRFDPGCRDLRQTVAGNRLGPPLMVHCVHRNVTAYPGGSEHTINASAVHEFDFIPWLLESPVASVSWHSTRSSTLTHRQDPQLVLIETENGVLTTLEMFVSAQYGYEVKCELVCENGTTSLNNLTLTTDRYQRLQSEPFPADSTLKYADAYRDELRAWIACLRTEGASPARFGLATAWDGYCAAVTAEAVIESMHSGDASRIPVKFVDRPSVYATPTATTI
jgi:myo-inositol 2-dehydrogenase/D-chiro-inositol 1-dehydrogenase